MVFKKSLRPCALDKVASVLGGLNPLEVAAAKSSMKNKPVISFVQKDI